MPYDRFLRHVSVDLDGLEPRGLTSVVEGPAPHHHLDVPPSRRHVGAAGCKTVVGTAESRAWARVWRGKGSTGARSAREASWHVGGGGGGGSGTQEAGDKVVDGIAGAGPTSRDCTRHPCTAGPPHRCSPDGTKLRSIFSRARPWPQNLRERARDGSCRRKLPGSPKHKHTPAAGRCRTTPMSAVDMFAPPVNRAMRVLDRSFFQKTIALSAARVFNARDIARCRNELDRYNDVLRNRVSPVRPDPDAARAQTGAKCLLLRPGVLHDGAVPAPCGARKC